MNNRDMYYSNYNAGGFTEPNFNPYMNAPQGFNQNSQFQAFGPNIFPNQNNINQGQNQNYYQENDYETRISKLERQIRSLDARISKLESSTNIDEEIINNTYMI